MSLSQTGPIPQVPRPEDAAADPHLSVDEPLAPQRVRTLLTVLIVSAFVVILNETTLSVALPRLMEDLRIPATTAQWVTSGFMLTMAVVIPTTGFLLERLPHRAVFLLAMSLFICGTLIAAFSPSFAMLMAGRVVQACGTAIVMPLMMTTIFTVVPAQRRGATMGLVSTVISVAPAIGPTVGGVVLAALTWRWLFLVMVPFAVAALVLGAVLMPAMGEPRRVKLDVLSLPLSGLGFGGLVMGLNGLGSHGGSGHGGVPAVPALVVAVVCLGLFVWRQVVLQRSDRALLDLRTFTFPTYRLPVILLVMSMATLFGVIILLPLYMQNVLGFSTLATGLSLLPGGLIMGLLGPRVGSLYDAHGPKVLVIPGSLLISTAMWVFTSYGQGTAQWMIIAAHMVLTSGLALCFTPLMTTALGSLPSRLYSHGSAMLSTLQQVAGAAGAALFITVKSLGAASAAAGGAQPSAAQAHGVHAAFLVAACMSFGLVLGAWLLPRRPTGQPTD